jgi:ribosome-associated protein
MINEIMEEITKEKSLQHKTLDSILIVETTTPFADLDEEVKLAIRSASDKKAFDIKALDLREVTSFAEFFVIASGSNQRQVQAICDEINEKLKEQLNARPLRIEGYNAAEWILLDYGDFIVHIFEQKAREFYDLERLWRDAKKVVIPEDI